MSDRPRKNPAAVALGRIGGRVRSEAKAAAARANASLPRTRKPLPCRVCSTATLARDARLRALCTEHGGATADLRD